MGADSENKTLAKTKSVEKPKCSSINLPSLVGTIKGAFCMVYFLDITN